MYLVKTPWLLRFLYPHCQWSVHTKEKNIYLTFDDGPHPEATPFVLDELKKFGAKATFFCIGKNVEEHPEIYRRIMAEGHRTGNHTQNHLNGWKTPDTKYLSDILTAKYHIDSDLFRPPYGRIKRSQLDALKKEPLHLKPVMWSVLSGDFDRKLSPEKCTLNVLGNAGPGSIVVFHDSTKALPKLVYALPRVLQHFDAFGYAFKAL